MTDTVSNQWLDSDGGRFYTAKALLPRADSPVGGVGRDPCLYRLSSEHPRGRIVTHAYDQPVGQVRARSGQEQN